MNGTFYIKPISEARCVCIDINGFALKAFVDQPEPQGAQQGKHLDHPRSTQIVEKKFQSWSNNGRGSPSWEAKPSFFLEGQTSPCLFAVCTLMRQNEMFNCQNHR